LVILNLQQTNSLLMKRYPIFRYSWGWGYLFLYASVAFFVVLLGKKEKSLRKNSSKNKTQMIKIYSLMKLFKKMRNFKIKRKTILRKSLKRVI
jgi:hypothetical protein